jgi:hypothetical protein
MVVRLRRDYRMTGEEIAARLRLARSTVAGHLARLGLGRPEFARTLWGTLADQLASLGIIADHRNPG